MISKKNEIVSPKKRMVPKIESLQQEQEFWENTPNALEYSSPVDLELDLPPRTKKRLVSIRLSEDQINLLKRLADYQDKKYQTMARDWLNERIRAEYGILQQEAAKKAEKKRA